MFLRPTHCSSPKPSSPSSLLSSFHSLSSSFLALKSTFLAMMKSWISSSLLCALGLSLLLTPTHAKVLSNALRGSRRTSETVVVSAVVHSNSSGMSCSIIEGESSDAAAIGAYTDDVDTNGWGSLTVDTTSAPSSNSTLALAFGAGCVEGYLTQHRIYQYWTNYKANSYGPSGPSSQLTAFMTKQNQWVRQEISKNAPSGNKFWLGMQHLMSQFDGLVAGYQSMAPSNESFTWLDLYMNNAVGDLEDLNGLFKSPSLSDELGNNHGKGPLKYRLTDCSGLVAILKSPGGDVQDIALGHSTWRDYYAMLRTYKVRFAEIEISNELYNSLCACCCINLTTDLYHGLWGARNRQFFVLSWAPELQG